MTLLTTPGFQLKETARWDGKASRDLPRKIETGLRREGEPERKRLAKKEEKEGLLRKRKNRGEEREEKGIPGESFSRGLGRKNGRKACWWGIFHEFQVRPL